MSGTTKELPELRLNGHHSPEEQKKRVMPWRDRAINHALAVRAREGDPRDVLVAEIRRHRHGWVTLSQWLDTDRVMKFLQAEVPDHRGLLENADFYREHGDKRVRPHTGWFALQWKNQAVELVLSPTEYRSTDIILVSQDEDAVVSLSAALNEFALRPEGRCLKYSGHWENAPELETSIRDARWEDVVLSPEISQGVKEAVEGFVHGRAAYKALGFAWRRGILLVGPPGTGKTMLCKAVAGSLPSWPVLYVRSIRDHCQKDSIRDVFTRARHLAPCLLIFEDIDGMVHEENRTVLLNELDGLRPNDGLLVLASSNHPEKIDEALLKRPSRFDRIFHVGLPKRPERAAYCRQLLHGGNVAQHLATDLDTEVLAERVAAASDGFTPAFLKEAVTAAALTRAQAGAMVLDAAFAEAVLHEVKVLKEQLKQTSRPANLASASGGGESVGLLRRD